MGREEALFREGDLQAAGTAVNTLVHTIGRPDVVERGSYGLLSQLCEGILWDLNVEAKRGVQNSSFPFAPSAHYLSKLVWVNMERLSQATNDDSIPSLSLHHHFSTATKVVTNTPGPTWSWRTTRSSTPVTLAARAAATTALRTSRTTRLSSASCALAEIIFPTSRARPPAQIVHW